MLTNCKRCGCEITKKKRRIYCYDCKIIVRKAYHKNWILTHRERRLKHQQKYKKSHPEQWRKWELENPEKARMQLYARKCLRKYKGDCCEMCGITGVRLVLHHTEYTQHNRKEFREEDAKKLLLLCHKCHMKLHQKGI